MKKSFKTCLIILIIVGLLCVISIAAMFFLKICPPQGPWMMPPWCEKSETNTSPNLSPSSSTQPSIKVDNNPSYIPYGEGLDYLKVPRIYITWAKGNEIFEKIPTTDFSWIVVWHSRGEVPFSTRQEIKSNQSRGIRYMGYLAEPVHQWDDKPVSLPDFATIDINGNPIYVQKPGMGDFASDQYWMNQIDPGWQEFLIKQTKEMIDMGIEGVLIDESTFNVQVIPMAEGTFDKISMTRFPEYLRNKYSTEQLQTKFQIDDINSFNLVEYIKTNLPSDWNTQRPPLPLIYEFKQFQLVETDKFYRDFYNQLKQYGQGQNRHIFFAFGLGDYEWQRLPSDYLDDYVTGEEFYFSGDSAASRAAVRNKIWEGSAPYRIVRVEIKVDKNNYLRNTKNLFKYVFADIYSSGGRMIVEENTLLTMDKNGAYISPDESIQYDLDEAAKYVNFATSHQDFFNLDEPADVALVRSEASAKGGGWAIPVEERDIWSSLDVPGVADMLLNLHVPFHMLYSGDEDLFKDRITLEKLNQYKVVIFPAAFMLSDEEVNAVLEYAKAGGKVITIRNFATHDLLGRLQKRDVLQKYRQDGIYKVGEGQWLTITDNLGEKYLVDTDFIAYQPVDRSLDDPTLIMFKESLKQLHNFEIVTTAPATINIRRYADNNKWILHLVNYNYDPSTDQFTASGPFDISMDTGGNIISKAKIYDLETGLETEIPVSPADGKVNISIPDLYSYAIVELLP